MKICKICKVEKRNDEFYRSRCEKDGYKKFCRQCVMATKKKFKDLEILATICVDEIKNIIPDKKNCIKCGVEKNITEFHRRRKNYRSECKTCANARFREYYRNFISF